MSTFAGTEQGGHVHAESSAAQLKSVSRGAVLDAPGHTHHSGDCLPSMHHKAVPRPSHLHWNLPDENADMR